MIRWVLLLLLFFSQNTFGQNNDEDLLSKFKDSIGNSSEVNVKWFGEIGDIYLKKSSYDSARKYYHKALAMNFGATNATYQAYIFNNLGVISYSTGNWDSSRFYYSKAHQNYLQSGDSLRASYCQINSASIYKELGLYEQALQNLFEATTLLEQLKQGEALASAYSVIASIYSRQNDLEKALEYHQQSLQIRRTLNLDNLVAASYNNIGIIFRKMALYDSAVYYYQKSLQIKEKLKDDRGAGITLNNLGMVHMDQGEYTLAEPYFERALNLRIRTADKAGTAITQNNFGLLYLNRSENQKALEYLNQADSLIKSLGMLEELRDNLESKVTAYERLGDHTKALEASKELLIIKDSLLNKDKAESLIEMQTKYETEKKIAEIELLEQDQLLQKAALDLRQTWVWVLIIFIIFLILSGLLIIYLWNKEKAAKKKVETLMQELHHRVKNNLQLLSSIFSLQSGIIQDETALEAVKSGENRVNAMAIIHQKLYRKVGTRSVNINEYLTHLIQELALSYGYKATASNSAVKIEDVELDVDKVIPLGLIVNELVSNSFKYAFPKVDKPYLGVKIYQKGNDLIMEIEDNGPGFKKNQTSESSMGLNIIKILSQQLKAKTQWNTQGHVKFHLQLVLN